MRKKSVIYKLLITFSSITSAVLILIGMFLTTMIYREYSNQEYERAGRFIEIIEEATTEFLNKNNEVGYENLKNAMKIIKDSVDMDSIILDSQGYVYAVSDDTLSYLKYTKIDIPSSEMELLKSGDMLEKDFVTKANKKLKSYYRPLIDNNSFNGITILIESSKEASASKLFNVLPP